MLVVLVLVWCGMVGGPVGLVAMGVGEVRGERRYMEELSRGLMELLDISLQRISVVETTEGPEEELATGEESEESELSRGLTELLDTSGKTDPHEEHLARGRGCLEELSRGLGELLDTRQQTGRVEELGVGSRLLDTREELVSFEELSKGLALLLDSHVSYN